MLRNKIEVYFLFPAIMKNVTLPTDSPQDTMLTCLQNDLMIFYKTFSAKIVESMIIPEVCEQEMWPAVRICT